MNRPINTALLGTAPKGIKLFHDGVFMFNNWNLDNGSNIRVIASNHDDIGTIDFDTYKTPLQDGGGVLGKYYRTKTIEFILSVSADSEESLNDLIDEIKFQTSKTEGILKIIINGITRMRTATCVSLKFNRKSFNVNRCGNIVLTFNCVNPHSQLQNPTNESFVAQTGTYSGVFFYVGRAESFPTLQLSIDSGTATGMSFELNGYTITIDTSLTAGDVITFDGEKKEVLVNNTEVAYTGPFTPVIYGDNVFTITNEGTFSGVLSYFTKFL